MSRAKPPVTPEAIEQIKAAISSRRVSHLENRYGQFHERTIDASGSAGQLMSQLNTIYTVLSGLGTVMRIVAGNPVLEDQFDPDDPTSEAPLSNLAISRLTNMTAAICELIADEIDGAAMGFNDRGQA
ncbi:hypothetical protein HHL21_12035 [Massilia sp. RP-1-19]|uniref:Uncharacterized protein n=1 Tax=Massilia polaris TaxID=2728846 RepID=A0A848HIV7_9BURK|nr:hypothetical protein [Massilia polaris]NML61796.1 hypothetical protein [Massilia polaris]